jgi:hypothetical protein
MKTKKFATIYSFPSGNELKIPVDAKQPILSSLVVNQPAYDLPIETQAQKDVKNGIPTPEARYKHDCNKCVFLGNYNEYDLYFCAIGNFMVEPTVIARYGEDGDYLSGLRNVRFNDSRCPLWMAKQLAKSINLL